VKMKQESYVMKLKIKDLQMHLLCHFKLKIKE
jgi:hypothetical protein